MFYEVLVSKIFRKSQCSSDTFLTYSYDEPTPLTPGTIVLVPLGKSTTPGIIYRKTSRPSGNFKIKSIISILTETPLPTHLLKSILWLSHYYLIPIPQVVKLFLPNGIEKKRRAKVNAETKSNTKSDIKSDINSKIGLKVKSNTKTNTNLKVTPQKSTIPLNTAQKQALKELEASSKNTKLLHGVTGSGKTNIYLTLAKQTFSRNQSTILLVPEIALTSQLVQIFQNTFGDSVTLIHSKQTESERHQTWNFLLESKAPRIVIGPRSALFAPLSNLGLIIIDEAHEPTYYQENAPKYHALRLASFIAQTLDIPCIYGTATPLLSDFYIATHSGSYVELSQKAKTSALKPQISVIDLKNRQLFLKNRYFSDQLLAEITENLANHRQTMIFHNRRGSASLTICENCGWQALCPTCYLPLTLHSNSFNLICHTCGFNTKVPSSCPECHHTKIVHKGFGTKLLESELQKLFDSCRIARFDTDNDRNNSLESLYDDVKSGDIDIIIGTQSIARGFDFPSLATVGIIQADNGLSLPDYSAEERTFHLLTQVLGRIGRGHIDKASAIVQTYQPQHPVIQSAISNSYQDFSAYLLEKRRKSQLPPFYFIARLYVTYKTEKATLTKIKQVHSLLSQNPDIIVFKPTPAFHERTSSGFSWQIIIKSPSRAKLLAAVSSVSHLPNLHFAIDPPSLL